MPLCLPRFKEMASKVFARRTFLWRNICGTVTATTFDLILRFYRLYLTLRYAVGAVYKPQDVSMMHGDQWYVFHHSAFRPSAFFCTIVTKLSTQPWAVPSVSPQCRSFKRDQTYHPFYVCTLPVLWYLNSIWIFVSLMVWLACSRSRIRTCTPL